VIDVHRHGASGGKRLRGTFPFLFRRSWRLSAIAARHFNRGANEFAERNSILAPPLAVSRRANAVPGWHHFALASVGGWDGSSLFYALYFLHLGFFMARGWGLRVGFALSVHAGRDPVHPFSYGEEAVGRVALGIIVIARLAGFRLLSRLLGGHAF